MFGKNLQSKRKLQKKLPYETIIMNCKQDQLIKKRFSNFDDKVFLKDTSKSEPWSNCNTLQVMKIYTFCKNEKHVKPQKRFMLLTKQMTFEWITPGPWIYWN